MQDIDFDELDRAVSSLISATPDIESDKALQQSAVSPMNLNATSNNAQPVASVNPVVVPSQTPARPARPIVSQPRPNLGRSMDFIRPAAQTLVARRSEPVAPIITQPTAASNSTPQPVNSIPPIGGSTMTSATSEEPSESPFIADAKVEKRPLNAFFDKNSENLGEETNQPTYAAAIALENSPVAGKDENPSISVDTPLPAELQNSLLQIESSDASNVSAPVLQQQIENPVDVSDKVDKTTADDNPKTNQAVAPTTPESNEQSASSQHVVNSIPQQYTPSSTPSPQNTGPIFDTSVYHNSAAIKPAKKSNAWIWILIVVLILIGATIGVGIYLFVK